MFTGIFRRLPRAALLAACPGGIRGRRPARVGGRIPDHPIRWLVPFSAGGGSDIATRIVARHVADAGPAGGGREPSRRGHHVAAQETAPRPTATR